MYGMSVLAVVVALAGVAAAVLARAMGGRWPPLRSMVLSVVEAAYPRPDGPRSGEPPRRSERAARRTTVIPRRS
jgi:hypothetical protein